MKRFLVILCLNFLLCGIASELDAHGEKTFDLGLATDHSEGWKSFDWFGPYWESPNSNWIYHHELGWLYRQGFSADSIWLWKSHFGWFWIHKDYPPYAYAHEWGEEEVWREAVSDERFGFLQVAMAEVYDTESPWANPFTGWVYFDWAGELRGESILYREWNFLFQQDGRWNKDEIDGEVHDDGTVGYSAHDTLFLPVETTLEIMEQTRKAEKEAIDLDDNETRDKIIIEAIVLGKLEWRGNTGEILAYAPYQQTPYKGWAKSYHSAFSKPITAKDKLHQDFGENIEALCMSIVNESVMGRPISSNLAAKRASILGSPPWGSAARMDDWDRSYHDHGSEYDQDVWEDDTNAWMNFLVSNDIKARIGVVHSHAAEMAPDRKHHHGPYINRMGVISEGFTPAAIELSSAGNFPYLKMYKEGATTAEQVAIFHEAFDSLTNGNTNLPEILVFNADNSDSMGFSEVNQALLQFKTEVEQIYTDKGKKVLIPNHTSSNFMGELPTGGEHIPKKQNGYLEGIRINEGEDYIRQSQMALKDAIDEYNKGDGQPLESDPNRQITGLRQFKDGNLDGQMTEWYTTGQKRLEYTWKDGKRDGLMLEYNPDGTEKSRAIYRDGEQVFD